MARQDTRQPLQRAKVSKRRRFRGPTDWKQHGARSQSGVKIRSRAAWHAWRAEHAERAAVHRELDEVKAGWRAREARKRALFT